MDSRPLAKPRRRGDRLRQLRAFCQAARFESFTRAADYLFSSQPSVSEQVRLLEEELDLTLFDRGGPRLTLTSSGRRLYQHALPLVVRMDRLPETFADLHRGIDSSEVQVAAGQTTASFVLPEYFKPFKALHPRIQMHVRIGSGTERLTWLRTYEVDVALGAVGIVPHDLEFRPLFSSSYVLITPEDHPLAGRTSISLREAAAWPKVGHPPGSYFRMLADQYARRYRFVNHFEVEVGGWTTIKQFVEAGLGIGVVPEYCLSEEDRVWRIPLNAGIPPRPYGIILRRDGLLSLPARQFVQVLDPDFPDEAARMEE